MKATLSIVLLQFLIGSIFGQGYIGLGKEKAKSHLLKYEKENNLKTVLVETDSSLTLQVRDSSKQPMDVIVNFGPSGKITSEARVASCDSCFQKYLSHALEKENLGWIKINEGRYLSKFSKKLLLEIPMDNKSYSFIIRKQNWSRREYQSRLSSK